MVEIFTGTGYWSDLTESWDTITFPLTWDVAISLSEVSGNSTSYTEQTISSASFTELNISAPSYSEQSTTSTSYTEVA